MTLKYAEKEDVQKLIAHDGYPAISMFMENTVQWPEVKKNRLKIKNLMKQAHDRLSKDMNSKEIEKLLQPAHDFLESDDVWRTVSGNIAVYIDKEETRIYQINDELKDSMHIGRFFDIRPMISVMNHQDFFLLTVSQEDIVMRAVSKNEWADIEVENMPESFSFFNSNTRGGKTLQNHTAERSVSTSAAKFHGHGGGKDIASQKLEEFAKKIASCAHKFIATKKDPLVIVGLNPLASLVDNRLNNSEVALHIERDPTAERPEVLIDEVRKEFQAKFLDDRQSDVKTILESDEMPPNFLDDTTKTLEKAQQGLVKRLYIRKMDYVMGDPVPVDTADQQTHHDEDLLNAASVFTLRNGGRVEIIDPEKIKIKNHAYAQLHTDAAG